MFEWDYAYVDDAGVVSNPELKAFCAAYARFSDQEIVVSRMPVKTVDVFRADIEDLNRGRRTGEAVLTLTIAVG